MKNSVSLFLLLIVLAVSGCATVPVEETLSISKPVTDKTKEDLNAAAIIVFRKPSYDEGGKSISERRLVNCIKNKVLEHNSKQNVISFNKIASKLFPDLPKKRFPRTPDDFSILLDDEKFYTDISAMGIRYLIFVGGATEETGKHSYGGCTAGGAPGGAPGCLWVVTWDKETQLSASILDVKLRNGLAVNIDNTSTGKSWFAIVGWFPVGMQSFSVHSACSNVGNDIGKILLDKATQ